MMLAFLFLAQQLPGLGDASGWLGGGVAGGGIAWFIVVQLWKHNRKDIGDLIAEQKDRIAEQKELIKEERLERERVAQVCDEDRKVLHTRLSNIQNEIIARNHEIMDKMADALRQSVDASRRSSAVALAIRKQLKGK